MKPLLSPAGPNNRVQICPWIVWGTTKHKLNREVNLIQNRLLLRTKIVSMYLIASLKPSLSLHGSFALESYLSLLSPTFLRNHLNLSFLPYHLAWPPLMQIFSYSLDLLLWNTHYLLIVSQVQRLSQGEWTPMQWVVKLLRNYHTISAVWSFEGSLGQKNCTL